jgi:succinylglutamate desuccinylase
MSDPSASGKPAAPRVVVDRREIGRLVGADAGPTLVVVAGIHGNEPAGIEAARRVFARLERGDVHLCGELVAFAGNVAALREGIRYHKKDLNRVWTEARVAELRATLEAPVDGGGSPARGAALDEEDREQLELLAAIEAAMVRSRGRVHLADFHTSSAAGIPFVLFGDTLAQREFVRVFPIPIVMGLEEQLDGVLSSYWTARGCVTFSVEGGQHTDPLSTDSLEAVIWLAMEEAGLLEQGALAEVATGAALLERRRSGLPRVLEVMSRKAITPEDAFKMAPGFRNLDHAAAGRLLAHDRNGEIRAPSDGMVILPLYQGLGSDGFFWGRVVSEARMNASRVLRRLRVDRLFGLLPGVVKDPRHPSRFIVNTRVARIYPLDVFHLFGYRRVRQQGSQMTLERQASRTFVSSGEAR